MGTIVGFPSLLVVHEGMTCSEVCEQVCVAALRYCSTTGLQGWVDESNEVETTALARNIISDRHAVVRLLSINPGSPHTRSSYRSTSHRFCRSEGIFVPDDDSL